MSYYEYYDNEPYYDPTPADEIFFEAKQKLEECLKESVKYKLTSTMDENKRLKEENEKMREKVRNIEWKEKSLEQRENDMERNVLRKKFTEMLKPLEEQTPMYNVDYKHVYIDKCDKCNDNRQIEYASPSGMKCYEDCKCRKTYVAYYPVLRNLKTLSLYKKRDYPYSVSVTPVYDSPSYDDTYCKFELKQYIENLDDNDIEIDISKLNYQRVGFKREEDCQKLCDFLNKKEKTPNKIVHKAKSKNKEAYENDEDDWD